MATASDDGSLMVWEMAMGENALSLPRLSGQGSQYISQAYQGCLSSHHCQVSMSRVAICYDTAVMESLFATLEAECASG